VHGLHQAFVVRKGSGVNRPLNQLQGQRVTLLGTVVSISSRSFSSRSVKQWPRSSWLVICRKVSRLQLERNRAHAIELMTESSASGCPFLV